MADTPVESGVAISNTANNSQIIDIPIVNEQPCKQQTSTDNIKIIQPQKQQNFTVSMPNFLNDKNDDAIMHDDSIEKGNSLIKYNKGV